MAREYLNHVDGKWVASSAGRTYENRNPATGELLGTFPKSNTEDVGRAVDAAERAFRSWRLVPAPRRGEILFRAGEILVRRKEELARAMTREMGKVLKETRGDVQEAIDMTFFAAGEGRRMAGDTVPSELPNKFAMCVRVPIGVIGVITPWNFPMAIPSWKIVPALMAGNTVVFKPATDTPESAYNLVGVLLEAGLPEGALNLVFGSGSEVGSALVGDPRVGMISFTGSTEVGSGIAERCPRLHKRVSTEMGGKNAILVMEDADLTLALEGAIWSAFGTSGQRCTAASRLIVHEAVLNRFTEMLVTRARSLRLGDGLDAQTEMGPVINQAAREKIHSYTEIGVAEGAALLCGGAPATEGALAKGAFYPPTVFGSVRPTMRIAQEEIFGPTVAILSVRDLDEAIAVNNATAYGLSTSIYTRDVNRAFAAMRDIDTGLVYVNAGTIGAEVHLPFGGMRGTGNGHREAGRCALETFTEWKALFIDFSGRLQRAQIDT